MAKKQVSITVEARSERGSGAARKMRRTGRVPCVVYGRAFEPLHLTIAADDVGEVIHHAGVMTVAGDGVDTTNVLVRDVQWNYLHTEVQHVDFQLVRMDEKIATTVPLEVVGTPAGVHDGGVLEQLRYDVEVEALPADLPEVVECDVSALALNDVFTIADLVLPAGVLATDDPDRVLFTLVLPRQEEEEKEGTESLLGEEPAEPELIGKGKDDEQAEEE